MSTNQEKILNYLVFFLLSLTGLASLLLVKNNYLYVFIFIFLLLYWQRGNATRLLSSYLKLPPSFLTFLTLGMVGVLLFQIFSPSPRFRERPVLTLIISLIFYLPYFFLWYKLFLKRRISFLKAFFLAGLGGILVFGIVSGKLTTTLLTAPTLLGGLFYVLLKAAGIFSVVGILTTFPFLFFSDEKTTSLTDKVEKKNNSGFGLIEVLIGVGIFLFSLSLVGTARHRQEVAEQKLATIQQSRLEKLANLREKVSEQEAKQASETSPPISKTMSAPTNIPKISKDRVEKSDDRPRKSIKEGEVKQPKSQASEEKGEKQSAQSSQDAEGFYPYDVADPASCQANPTIPGCEVYYYDPYSDPTSPEYQAQLQEQWYASQQDPSQLFFNDPVQLWSQDPFLYEMYQDIYDFNPIPGFP